MIIKLSMISYIKLQARRTQKLRGRYPCMFQIHLGQQSQVPMLLEGRLSYQYPKQVSPSNSKNKNSHTKKTPKLDEGNLPVFES